MREPDGGASVAGSAVNLSTTAPPTTLLFFCAKSLLCGSALRPAEKPNSHKQRYASSSKLHHGAYSTQTLMNPPPGMSLVWRHSLNASRGSFLPPKNQKRSLEMSGGSRVGLPALASTCDDRGTGYTSNHSPARCKGSVVGGPLRRAQGGGGGRMAG